jgi:hypothetical protein
VTGDPDVPGEPAAPETADAVRAAVLGVPGVAGLHGGAFGEVATHYPGRSVPGVQVRPQSTTVHVVLDWGVPAQATATLVRAAVTGITHTPVDVVVADVTAPGETSETSETSATSATAATAPAQEP